MPTSNLVAVYGSLRKGLHNHHIIEDAEYLGTDKVKNFSMYSLGSFPFIKPTGDNIDTHIEVYRVTPEQFSRLDMLEGYPSFYDRKQIDTNYGSSWIYFIDNDENHDAPPVPDGNWPNYIGAY